jgi:hypothetical protein
MSKKKPGNQLGNSMPAIAKAPDHDDYEVEGHLRTLMEAEKIKADPEKMKKVHKLAGRHHKSLQKIRSVKDIQEVANAKYGPKEDEGL